MLRTAQRWKGIGPVTLGALVLSGALARGDDAKAPAPLSRQLTELGRQALAQGDTRQARVFLTRALALNPSDAEARAAIRRVSLQAPAPTPAPPAPGDAPPPADAPEPAA